MKYTKKFQVICLLLWTIFIFFPLPKSAFADGNYIKISPSTFRIEAKPPADIWAPFTIENQGDQPVNLMIGYKSFDPQASENGNVVYLKNGEPITGLDKKIFDKIQVVNEENISESQIALGPKQSEKLRLHIILPDGELTSDYYFSLLFLENPSEMNQNNLNQVNKTQDSISSIQTGLALNILLAIGNNEIPQADIDKFSSPWFVEGGPVFFNLTVFNNGSHFIMPKGTIFIKNMFGQTVGKISIPENVILAGTSRTLTSNEYQSAANRALNLSVSNDQQNIPLLVWPENFLLGMYKATLSLSLSDNGPVYSRSIYFFAFPLNYLFTIIILVGIILYIYFRVKKKIS